MCVCVFVLAKRVQQQSVSRAEMEMENIDFNWGENSSVCLFSCYWYRDWAEWSGKQFKDSLPECVATMTRNRLCMRTLECLCVLVMSDRKVCVVYICELFIPCCSPLSGVWEEKKNHEIKAN